MRILSVLLLFVAMMSQAQNTEIITISTDDRILYGHINDEYPITVYLKIANRSDNLGYVFSVSGWYKYDNVGTPIPLAGVWTGGELHLFASNDTRFLANMENMTYESKNGTEYIDNHIYELESFAASIPIITERFHLELEGFKLTGKWKNKDKEFGVSINNPNSSILKIVQYLKLPNGKFFDMSNLALPDRTIYELEASVNNGQNLLIHYVYHANLNYMGRCGGATNSGKLALAFDDAFKLTKEMKVEFTNCYTELVVDDLTKISDTKTEYKIMDYSSSKEQVYIVDLVSATIQKK